MDWKTWQPGERATLCFIQEQNRLLLIRKLRGLGAGKINAPGGKLESGETAAQAAIRETMEEICVVPKQLKLRAELSFAFVDGYNLFCSVFWADQHTGEPRATDEAIPIWCDIAELPYDEMWQDDRLWLPLLLQGKNLRGYFVFDGEQMLRQQIEELAPGTWPLLH